MKTPRPQMSAKKNSLGQETGWLLREKYKGKITPAARRDIARLENGEHVSYIIGWSPFLDCHIDLSTRPLIPRPETEYWAKEVIDLMKTTDQDKSKVLDIFCGSGCVGTAILKHIPKASIDFADIESKYFTGIKKSLKINRIPTSRANFIQSDVFKNLRGSKYDFILANPPYIPTAGRAVAQSVLKNEPKRALFAGKDGLRYIKNILSDAKAHLNTNGMMVIEFDPPQKKQIGTYAKTKGWKSKFFKDQYGRWRFVSLVRIK